MKKLFMLALCIALLQNCFATVWLVDNNPNSPTIYRSIQEVIDSHAANGDTILVEGSPNGYGEIFVTKQIILIGEGYSDIRGENATVQRIFIRSSNVVITGFNVETGISFETINAPGNQLANITVERCKASYVFGGGPSNNPHLLQDITIRNTVSFGPIRISYSSLQDIHNIVFDSLTLENNIFYDPSFFDWGVGNTRGANTIIVRNNLFINGDNGGNTNTLFFDRFTSTNFHDAILYNNIFFNCNPTGSLNCTFMNNLTFGNGNGVGHNVVETGANDTLPGPVNNNIYSRDPLFVSYTIEAAFSYDFNFHTRAGSPCIGAGVGGTDIGIYGGLYPFNVGEGPKIPVVSYVNISKTAVPQNSEFFLQFDARVRK